MTIDANLLVGLQIGWVLGMLNCMILVVIGASLSWKMYLRSRPATKRGGYAAEEQE